MDSAEPPPKVHVYERLCKASVKLCVKCLEGTTERSDSNRVRSARISAKRTMCLEGTTPQDMQFVHRKRRTAFQAELLQQFLPRTSSPVTIATLCSGFQAQTLHEYKRFVIREIRATYKVAIISTLCYSCIFVKFVGIKNRRIFTSLIWYPNLKTVCCL